MLRFVLSRAGLWCVSVAGAALVAAAIAALAVPGANTGVAAFVWAVMAELPHVIVLDPGVSTVHAVPAFAVAGRELLVTLELLLAGLAIALAVGVPLGAALSAKRLHLFVAPVVQTIDSVPIFCAALLLALITGAGAATAPDGPILFVALRHGTAWAALMRMAPLLWIVGLVGAGAVALSVRRGLERAIGAAYLDGLVRLGLARADVLRIYVARDAAAAALNEAGEIVLALLAAAAVAEWVFAWPGAGAGFIRAVALQDWPVVAVFVFVIALVRFSVDLIGALAARALLGEAPAP